MDESSSVPLVRVDPDLFRYLSEEDRAEAAALAVPIRAVGPGPVQLTELLHASNAFAAVIFQGMALQAIQVAGHTGLSILGPGDIVAVNDDFTSAIRSGNSLRSETELKLALLGNETLVAAHRWPRLLSGLMGRMAEQAERRSDHLVVCQLPRVEDRILAMMWQLAESWGFVTRSGTVVPLSLTHELLGGLVGARRSTVTIALGRLAERGALVHTGDGWLLLAAPPESAPRQLQVEAPRLLGASPPQEREWTSKEEWAALRETVERLHAEHERATREVHARLRQLQSSRTRGAALRERRAPITPRSAPSAT